MNAAKIAVAPSRGPRHVRSIADAPDIRDDAKRLVDKLPAGAGWDDLAYEVYVRQAIEQGLAEFISRTSDVYAEGVVTLIDYRLQLP